MDLNAIYYCIMNDIHESQYNFKEYIVVHMKCDYK